ncbi:hypothetical protein K3U18_003545 [Salmonella enterica]|nr:hypothetical protein [Salmonella enterica subsp. enterica serovar Sandiego]ECL6015445.1 hypothetical protein [Salmonella enterica]EGI5345053.1 hypothetical protein [Salmonella enterica subsp. enterica serovar Sandiego]EHX2262816.1 hypothetical protein [Salmonella enterica]EJG3839484.1 hypothetical protein [Salmonella enterica]
MINPDKSLALKALAGAQFLRMYAEAMADDDDFFIALMLEPHTIAANAIEQLVKENEELRAQLIAFQKAAHSTVAFDLARNEDTTGYVHLVSNNRVRLKVHPYQHGTISKFSTDENHNQLCFVRFDSEFEIDRWVKAKNLELIPDE